MKKTILVAILSGLSLFAGLGYAGDGDLIVNSGKVGIYTTTPKTYLHVGDAYGNAVTALTGFTYYPNIYNKNIKTYDGSGNNYPVAVMGESAAGRAVVGVTQTGAGVYGTALNSSGDGVYGRATNGDGVLGISDNATGVYAYGGSYDFYGGSGEYARNGIWSNYSDKSKKENFTPVDGDTILDKIGRLAITQWNFTDDENKSKHLGPVAQDFYAAFGLGEDDTHISTVDLPGVALAGVKALYEKINQQQKLIEELTQRVANLEQKK